MLICAICNNPFEGTPDFDVHYTKTGHDKIIEMTKSEWEASVKLISKAIDDLVKKGYYQYDNDENGELVIKLGPNAHLRNKN